ncbi:ABC transporter ATP-binding protein [Ferruginibacter sp. SUN106]|uniref:ABC transporter ATP-binding protein n=1 Tax=Ferruginibacter sp. SUN106 TaxID=2978348 RepID=UPI003D35A7A8
MLKLNKIGKSFGSITACDLIDLSIKQGEFFFILGSSGCGKSTLLKIIAGLLKQDSGDIEFDGVSYNEIPPYERPFNMVFQNYSLFPHLSVFNNVAFGLKMNNTPKIQIKRKVEETLSLFQISELAGRKPDQLSGGQQQRVALARAIVNQPKILLLDEPLSALDEKLRLSMQQTLKELKAKLNTTFIYVTHNQEEALSMGDRIAIMNKGKIEQISTPRDIYYSPLTRFIAEFMGEVNIINYRVLFTDCNIESTEQFNDEKEFLSFNPDGLKRKEIEIVRPEDIEINSQPLNISEYAEVKKGKVIQILFKGTTTVYIVQCEDGMVMKSTDFNVGFIGNILTDTEVYIGWKKTAIKNVEA